MIAIVELYHDSYNYRYYRSALILTDKDKYDIYCHHFTPEVDFKFPKEKSQSFKHQYLRKYNWLVYSKMVDIVTPDARKGKGTFVETPFTNFKKAYELCDSHAERHYHKDAVVFCDSFVQQLSGKQESVVVQLRRDLSHCIQTNRQRLHSIVETIILCGRQSIPLRGHRDSGTDIKCFINI